MSVKVFCADRMQNALPKGMRPFVDVVPDMMEMPTIVRLDADHCLFLASLLMTAHRIHTAIQTFVSPLACLIPNAAWMKFVTMDIV